MFLKILGMVTERFQNLFEFIYRRRHLQPEVIQPFLIDKAHITDSLNGFLALSELLDPGKRPDMPVLVGAHRTVFRIFVEDLFQVRHILVDIILQRNDNALRSVSKKITV